MVRLPNLKLIYLIRDPRATLLSQAKVFRRFKLPRDIDKVSSLHCKWLSEDLVHLRQLRDMYPDRIKVVRYEHGVLDPQDFATEIYKFLGLAVSKELRVSCLKIIS
ncbi:carbohydrate sulfotransferase 3-like [Elysia marginata]|uniref:Carbohydrate sulfotransferase 3-like n=1 Tax=Elysia marginata TaxID=1093978 RepID=A0AAV4EWN2_9GAST|nr:carbohydrate sulfotransferase 3-like [Elysia marginata]